MTMLASAINRVFSVPQTRADGVRAQGRDVRIDAFRGLALVMIFFNHAPGSWMSWFTLRQFGFSDAAELFVLISGFTCAAVFGRMFERDGWRTGSARVLKRVGKLYVRHIVLIVGLACAVILAAKTFENPIYFEMFNLAPLANDTYGALGQMLLLSYQLPYLNILPMYMALLAAFPLMYALLRVSRLLALTVSLGVYAGAHALGWNLVEYPSGNGWFFNPIAWQLLFVIGAVVGLDRPMPALGRRTRTLLTGAAACYVLIGVLVAAPWAALPGLEGTRLIDWSMVPPMNKSLLSLWRLAHILAITYLALRFVPVSFYKSWMGRTAALLGRHSLDIFCLATVLSFLGMFIFVELGRDWPSQLAVNLGGMAIMIMFASRAERRKKSRRSVSEIPATQQMAIPTPR